MNTAATGQPDGGGAAVGRTDFRPFDILPSTFRRVGLLKTRWTLLSILIAGSLAIVVTALEGTLGGLASFQPVEDLQRVFSLGSPSPAQPNFTLTRDIGTAVILIAGLLAASVVHRQWRVLSTSIRELEEEGAIRPRDVPTFSGINRLLRHDAIPADEDKASLYAIIRRSNSGLAKASDFSIVFAGITTILVFLYVKSQERLGIFGFFAPAHMSPVELDRWQAAAYKSWWASDAHLGGQLALGAVAFVCIYVVVLQNIVGLMAANITLALPAYYHLEANWTSDDGCRGWRPIGRAFQTVRWSMTLHGVALSIEVLLVGIGSVKWILPLYATWLVGIIAYVAVPWRVFRKAAPGTIRRLHEDLPSNPSIEAIAATQLLAERRIRPLRLSRFQVYGFVVSIVLPIAVAWIQLVASLRLTK
ncbi:MAG: hypothetical protein Q7V57_18400 [Actinomycetota bacterium]|nr:hypothetical protein [Actinomycetota bacterium]